MSKVCSKCNYTRQPSDYSPEWECPNCQVIYVKANLNNDRIGIVVKSDAKLNKFKCVGYVPKVLLFFSLTCLIFLGISHLNKPIPQKYNQKARISSTDINTAVPPRLYEKCKKQICIKGITVKDSITLTCENNRAYYITARFIINSENLSCPSEIVTHESIPPNSSTTFFDVNIKDNTQPSPWKYSYKLRYGDINLNHNEDLVYRLPFKTGSSFKVSQSHNGAFTHNQKHNKYAIDFKMPVGTEIYAARRGYIAGLKEDSDKGGPNKSFIEDGNYIKIVHDDGSVAIYYHLDIDGVLVDVGDYVYEGEHIGFSGNTGFTRGPHLHFTVQKPSYTKGYTDIPVKFATKQGYISKLKKNKSYTAIQLR